MKELFKSIYTEYSTGGSDFYTNTGGRMWPYQAEDDVAYPYAVYHLDSNTPEYWMNGEQFEEALILFNIYSDTRDTVEIHGLYENIKTAFDDVALTVTGYTTVKFEREFAILLRDPELKVWQYSVQYRVLLKE